MQSETDLSDLSPSSKVPAIDDSRLAGDNALAVEAQDELQNVITQFVDRLRVEEQQLVLQAGEYVRQVQSVRS